MEVTKIPSAYQMKNVKKSITKNTSAICDKNKISTYSVY